jgi:hypothetical protein
MRNASRIASARLLVLICLLAPAMADAAEVLLAREGLTARLGTSRAGLGYSRPFSSHTASLGLDYQWGPAAVSVPIGISRELTSGPRYTLLARAAVSPMLAMRGGLDLALTTRVGMDNRFMGRTLAALIGIEVDAALSLTSFPDNRQRYLVVAGVGHHGPRLSAWLIGRAGYTEGGVGRGAVFTELGIVFAIPFSGG